MGFVQQVFSDVGCQLWMDVFCPLDLQDLYPYYGTSETSAVLSQVDLLSHALTKLEFRQKKSKCNIYFFHGHTSGHNNLQNQILKELIGN